jgi:hypothetical protein
MSKTFFRKWRPLGDIYEESDRAKQVTVDRKQYETRRVIKTEITDRFRRAEIVR